MPEGFCEVDDVRKALQESQLSGSTDPAMVKPAIRSVSQWLRKASDRYWYDSGGTASDLAPTTPHTATNVHLDVPSSPHAQDRQIHRGEDDIRYPVTNAGPYCRIPLPHAFVGSGALQRLAVRGLDGDLTDWTANDDYVQGTGEDYYVREEDQEGYGQSYLYLRATAIGPRVDYQHLLTLDYDYGLDAQDEGWQDVRRGVANLAAAQLVTDDDVLTSIPDDGQLVSVSTQYDQHIDAALNSAMATLSPYLEVPTA